MELIKIKEQNGKQLVEAKELYNFLKVKTAFKDWFPRMTEYGFKEGIDFSSILSESTGGRPSKNYIITLNMAKELSMIQRTQKGKEAREYFIKCEEAWNSPEMILARASQIQSIMIENYKEKVEVLEEKIEKNKPKVVFAESIEVSKSSILIGEMAKLIKQSTGLDIGQNRLFHWMRENGYLIKRKGSDYNMPTQKSIDKGLLSIKEGTRFNNGVSHITKVPKITGKGQIYFINKFQNLRSA
jgi:anti-repressor protein